MTAIRSLRILGAITAVIFAWPVAGCGGSATPAPPTPSAGATTSSPGAASTTSRPPVPEPSWGSGPVTVVHRPAVPPVPVMTGVRYAAHPGDGYDRIVFDFGGPLPGYSARYVSQVRADPSDRAVTVPGRRHLLVVFEPAQAHREDGVATISGVHPVDLPALRAYAIVGDFEGHVSVALGVDDEAGFRMGELPGRIYLDVAA